MNQENIVQVGRCWFDEIALLQCAFSKESVPYKFEFSNWENVSVTDVGVVVRFVKDAHALCGVDSNMIEVVSGQWSVGQ